MKLLQWILVVTAGAALTLFAVNVAQPERPMNTTPVDVRVERHPSPPEGHAVILNDDDRTRSRLLHQILTDFQAGAHERAYMPPEHEANVLQDILHERYQAAYGRYLFPQTGRYGGLVLTFQISVGSGS